MTTSNSRSPELASRLAGLSPEKQALLARKLADRSLARGALDAERIPLRSGAGPAPLSHAQELLWLYEQMTPGTAAYNVPIARRVRGPLDLGALERALDAIIVRHESLRTVFIEGDGNARQVALPPQHVLLEKHDLRALAPSERSAESERLLREAAARPFDLARGTMPRVVVVRTTDDEALLLLVVHHIVFDGGSVTVLLRELATAYAAAVEGMPVSLPPLLIQFADYAQWERRELQPDRLEPMVAFWREYLEGATPTIELPTDFPRPATAIGPGARYACTLPLRVRNAVHALATAQNVTPFTVLLSGFQVLLHRHSGQADLVVGTPVSGRSRSVTEGLVGYLANVLALRARLEDDPSFVELVRRSHDGVCRAFEHQDVPYELLARELRAGHKASEQGLFRVVFVMQDGTVQVPTLGAASLEGLGIELNAAKFELTVSVAVVPDGLRVVVEYRSDLFRSETIERLVEQLGVLLVGAALAPATRVSRLPILTEAEQRKLLVDWNDSDAGWPTSATLHELFEAQVAGRGDAIAVRCGDVALSYAALDRRANRLAWRLRERGVGADVLVAVCMEKSVDTVAVLLGILKAGGAYVPMDPGYPDDRIAFMLQDSAARLVVTEAALLPRLTPLLASSGAEALFATDGWADGPKAYDVAPPSPAGPANLCYVIYTSGSTGRPKGVLIEHRNVVRLLFNDRFQFAFSERDVWTVFHSFSFDFSVWEMYGALLYGGRLVVVPKHVAQQPAEYLALLAAEGVTVLNQVPSAFYGLMREEIARPTPILGALRYVIFGGEALQPALLRDWKARYPETTLVNMFGITETTVHVTFKEIGDAEIEDGSSNIGGPIPTLTTYVLDQRLQLVPFGVTGELCVGGAGVARGYLNRPDLTAERFVPHPFRVGERMYRSGDLGRMRPTGEIEYLGRRDAQVKLRGFRIELGEIEAVLAQHPSVAASVVTLRSDGPAGPRLAAYCVPAGAPAGPGELRKWTAARLPDFMVPATFMELPFLPLTSNGKVDRNALPHPNNTVDAASPVQPPRDDVEHVIASIWSEVLDMPQVDVETSFLDLGGHSLLAVRVVAQVTKIFRAPLTLRRFFDEPTVAGVARALTANEPKPGQTASIATLLRKLQSMTPDERDAFRRGNIPTGKSSESL